MKVAVHWKHVLPCSIGLIALFVLAQFIVAWVVQSSLIRSGERSVGARVEVGDTQVLLLDRRLSLRDVRVANPQAPLRNLVQADRCDFEFEAASLLHKKTVVRQGAVTGLRFGTPRDTSGALADANSKSDTTLVVWLDDAAAKSAKDWLDRLHERFDRDLVNQLESIRLTNALVDRWPQEYADLEGRVREIRQRTTAFQAEIRRAQENPLRNVDFLERVPDEIAKIRADVTALSHDVENLPKIADEDRRAIVAAREHDEQLLSDELRFDRIDADVLSAYLLQERLNGPLGDLVGWLHWIRRMVPAEKGKLADVASDERGRDVVFVGCKTSPDLFIRKLQLQGTARIGGQPLELFGTLTDVSDKPSRHDEPIRLRLVTRGSLPLSLQATIDRTGPVARDQLLIDCGGILLPKLRLGGSDKLRLSLAPTTASLNVSITLEGDRLSGDVHLVQKQVQITPSVGDQLARLDLDDELEDMLGNVESLATRISIGGTLNEPRCRLWSNLGPAVAEALDRAIARTASGYTQELLADSQYRVNERLAEFDRQLADQRIELRPQLVHTNRALDHLADDPSDGKRLSQDQLGHRLPAESLFR